MFNLRNIQVIFSAFLFLIVFITCWKVTGLRIIDIQLSHWGIDPTIGWLWNTTLVIIATSFFLNFYKYALSKSLRWKYIFITIFLFQAINISLMGIVVMGNYIHNLIAYIYFFTLPLCIFLFASFNRKYMKYKEWGIHIFFSVSMILIPLILLFTQNGMALAEAAHSFILIGWNIYLLQEWDN